MPGKPSVAGISPPIAKDRPPEQTMDWGRSVSALSGNFLELTPAERRKLEEQEEDVQVSMTPVTSGISPVALPPFEVVELILIEADQSVSTNEGSPASGFGDFSGMFKAQPVGAEPEILTKGHG